MNKTIYFLKSFWISRALWQKLLLIVMTILGLFYSPYMVVFMWGVALFGYSADYKEN